VGELTEEEKRLLPYRVRLTDPLPEDRKLWGASEHLHELGYQLLDFHRRAAKPEWWAMFSRMEMVADELLDDGECLAGLTPDPACPPRQEKRSLVYTYRFPEQESKLKTGDSAAITQTAEPVRELTVDDENRRVSFKRALRKEELPKDLCLGPGMPVSTKALTHAVFRFADSLLEGDGRYPAIEAILNQSLPKIRGKKAGSPIVPAKQATMAQIVKAIANLQESYLFVQGPPGAGKTYTGSHIIVALLQQGCRVGVSSNSHKAINNLLHGVVKVAKEQGYVLQGAKKSTKENGDSIFDGESIDNVYSNKEIWDSFGYDNEYHLIAGTAWLFADPEMDQQLDYLFVDEAGQVALANLVAMGTSARNIVLLGDQMQLGQPIQGVHPGRSGESSLEYLLNGMATIAPERGIFLATTWRMHPDVCRFISEAVYDGRLQPEPNNSRQTLLLAADAHPALIPTGIRYLPIDHDACSQRSHEEADLVKELVESLLQLRYRDKQGQEHPLSLNDILIVAPYNMQVNLLKQVLRLPLPEG
jgi:hypothetical protein